jgi:hypothetical protein
MATIMAMLLVYDAPDRINGDDARAHNDALPTLLPTLRRAAPAACSG